MPFRRTMSGQSLRAHFSAAMPGLRPALCHTGASGGERRRVGKGVARSGVWTRTSHAVPRIAIGFAVGHVARKSL